MAIGLGTALVGSALLGGASSVFGASKQADAAAQSAAIQTQFARESRDLAEDYANRGFRRTNNLAQRNLDRQRRLIRDGYQAETGVIDQTYDDAVGYYDPYIEGGAGAQNALAFELGVGARPEGYQGFKGSGGYQFRLQEAQRALEASAAARGGLFSGATGQALADRTQDYATQEYDNFYNRLAAMAGRGQQASSLAAGLTADAGAQRLGAIRTRTGGLSSANNNAFSTRVDATTVRNNAIVGAGTQANQTAGNAQAQSALARGQAFSNAATGITNNFTNALGFYAGQTA